MFNSELFSIFVVLLNYKHFVLLVMVVITEMMGGSLSGAAHYFLKKLSTFMYFCFFLYIYI